MRFLIIVCTSLMLFTAAVASAKPQLPARPAQLQAIHRLIGDWKGTGVLVMGGKRHLLKATWTCREQADGYTVVCMLAATGSSPYREVELFAFEKASGRYHWITSCTQGQVHDYVGDLDGDTLRAQDRGAQATLRFIDDRALKIQILFGENGKDGSLVYDFSR